MSPCTEVDFAPAAEADPGHLDRPVAQRVLRRLRWLAENFEATTPEVLSGSWQGVFKLRVGDHRVLYTCDHAQQKITVHVIRHRREVYRKK